MLTMILGVKSVKVPSLIEFNSAPDDKYVYLASFLFAIFSIISFVIQHRIEARRNPNILTSLIVSLQDSHKELFNHNIGFNSYLKDVSEVSDALEKSSIRRDRLTFISGPEASKLTYLNKNLTFIKENFEEVLKWEPEFQIIYPGALSLWSFFKARVETNFTRMKKVVPSSYSKLNIDGVEFLGVNEEEVFDMQTTVNFLRKEVAEVDLSMLGLIRNLKVFRAEKISHSYALSFIFPLILSLLFLFCGVLSKLL